MPNKGKLRVLRVGSTGLADQYAREAAKWKEASAGGGGFGNPTAETADGRGAGGPDDRVATALIRVDPTEPAGVPKTVEPTLNEVVLDKSRQVGRVEGECGPFKAVGATEGASGATQQKMSHAKWILGGDACVEQE